MRERRLAQPAGGTVTRTHPGNSSIGARCRASAGACARWSGAPLRTTQATGANLAREAAHNRAWGSR